MLVRSTPLDDDSILIAQTGPPGVDITPPCSALLWIIISRLGMAFKQFPPVCSDIGRGHVCSMPEVVLQ